jgi:hypothetical protein
MDDLISKPKSKSDLNKKDSVSDQEYEKKHRDRIDDQEFVAS